MATDMTRSWHYGFLVGEGLKADTALHRYMSLEAFLAFVETRRLRLSNVNLWEDPWELFLSKLPSRGKDGTKQYPSYSFHHHMYGSCWSLVSESDAMWRIYSPYRNGIQVRTSVDRFRLVRGLRGSHLDIVSYFDTIENLVKSADRKPAPFAHAFNKRVAFRHEEEVRFVTHGDLVDGFGFPEKLPPEILLSVDPNEFVEGLTLDPRAEDWFVETITKYCERAGLVSPTKSRLYEPDPHETSNWVRDWVPVAKAEPPAAGE